VDESTGAMSKSALPPFFEYADLEHSWVRPVVPGTEGSPLGSAAGLHGWRVRTYPDDGLVGEGLDGARVRLNQDDHVPLAALHLPGRTDPLTVTTCDPNWLELFDTNEIGTIRLDFGFYRPWQARGTPLVPPLQWWHCLRVRDSPGSHALRRVSVHTARELMDAARAGTGSAAVDRLLPEITHPELLAGVHGLVDYALSIENDLVAFKEAARAAEHSEPDGPAADHAKELVLTEALNLQGAPLLRTYTVDTDLGMPDLLRALRDLVGQHEAGTRLHTDLIKPTDRVQGLMALAYPGMLAWQAASPVTRRKHREALVDLLTAMTETGLTEPGGRWRLVILDQPSDRWAETVRETVVPSPGGFTAKLGSIVDGDGQHGTQAIQYSKVPGFFPKPPGYSVIRSFPLETSFNVAVFTKALAEHGVLSWRPEAVTELSARTGMNQGKAALLLGGLPGVAAGHNALDTQDRLLLGLTGSRAAEAKASFAQLAEADRFALLQAMVPADPAALWSEGPDLAAVADMWVKRFGRSVPVDEHTMDSVRRYTDMATIADPAKWAAHLATFTIWKLHSAVDLLWLLAYRLPVGSPLRARLPAALDSLRTAVQGKVMPLNDFLSSANLGALLRLPEDEAITKVDVDGWLTLHRLANSKTNYSVKFRPSAYRRQNRDVFAAVLDRLGMPSYLLATVDALNNQDLTDACAQHADVSPGSYLQNPLVTVPDLVGRVAERYTVDSDVAVLYLQLLALPDPNDTNAARWTGWSPERMRAARLALAETGLVLVAKRKRSGRSMFLPGGWQIQARPRCSMETWKLSMFEHSPVPHRTVAESFRLAWRRIEDGDIPAYQELQQ
jgi:hypothetical protein